MPIFGFTNIPGSVITQMNIAVAQGTDPDADAFITAAGITDSTQQSAINQLVLDLKGYNIWTKMKAIYPIVGGTSTSHKWNLINPLDTDAAYRLAFSVGWTHASTGMAGAGTGYASSYLIPSTALTLRNTHLSMYIRTDTAAGTKIEIGCGNSGTANPAMSLMAKYSATNAISDSYSTSTNRLSVSNSDAKGFYIGSRTSSTLHKLYKNGSVIGTDTNTESNGAMPNVQLLINGFLFGASVIQQSDREFSYISIGDGLDDTESANYYTAVQAYQTTLSRNV